MNEYIVDLTGVATKSAKDADSTERLAMLWGLPVCEKIVRCRDCKQACPYGDGIECLGPLVQTWDYFNDQPLHNPVDPDGFCAWGKPKE